MKNLIQSIETPVQQIGNKDATVTIVVFEDYQCPYSKKFNTDILPKITKEYIDTGKVLFIHQDLAFLGPESISSAEAALCAGDQGKFWEYREYLYNNQGVRNSGSFNDENLNKFAKNLGLNMSDFNTCSESGKYRADVIEARNFAKSYGITVTPTFVINGEVVKGVQPLDIFEDIINKILKD